MRTSVTAPNARDHVSTVVLRYTYDGLGAKTANDFRDAIVAILRRGNLAILYMVPADVASLPYVVFHDGSFDFEWYIEEIYSVGGNRKIISAGVTLLNGLIVSLGNTNGGGGVDYYFDFYNDSLEDFAVADIVTDSSAAFTVEIVVMEFRL